MRDNYVSPDVLRVESNSIEHPMERQSFRTDVLNPLLQNLFAGVGAAVVAISISTVAEVDIPNEWSAAIVGVIFGILTVGRFSSDEIRGFLFDWAAGAESSRNEELLLQQKQQYEQQLDALRARIRSLEAVLVKHNLQASSPLQPEGKVGEEYSSAVKLLGRFFHGLDVSRDEVTRLKILNRPQWLQGMNFLRDAGVVDQKNKLLVLNYDRALAMLNQWAVTKQRSLA